MLHPYEEPAIPYQPEQDPAQVAPQNDPAPSRPKEAQTSYTSHAFDVSPNASRSPTPRRRVGGLRTGAIIALTLLLSLVFGTGLFAGWEYGRGTAVIDKPTTSLQTGSNPQVVVPTLTGTDIEKVREAVIAKVRPAVVQVNVT